MDGFPIPVCHYGRAYRHKNYQDLAAFSHCAAKQERYYGFEGHLLVNLSGMIKGFTFAPANVDEKAVAPDLTDNIHVLLTIFMVCSALIKAISALVLFSTTTLKE